MMTGDFQMHKPIQQNLWIRNPLAERVTLCIEPWANELFIPPGDTYLVTFEGPEGQFPAVEWGERRITVYGWSGSVASIFRGEEKLLSCEVPVPSMPS